MSRLTILTYGTFCCSILLISCGKDGNKAAPKTTLLGEIRLFDEFGKEQTDRSGVQVALAEASGTNTTTNVDGSFRLTGIPSGKQRIIITKAGYGTYKSSDITFADQETSLGTPVRLGQIPTWSMTGMPYNSYIHIVFEGALSATSSAAQPRVGRLYMRAGLQAPTLTEYDVSVPLTNRYSRYWVDSLSHTKLVGWGLPVGKVISYAIYPDNPTADSYKDPATGKEVHPAVRTDIKTSNTGGFFYP